MYFIFSKIKITVCIQTAYSDMHNKTNRGVLIMEQTLQKRKALHQPVGNLHVGFERIKLVGGKYVILY